MRKLLLALAVATATVAAPAVAGTAHDFDPSRVSPVSQRRTLDGQCYETTGDSKVCFFRLSGETYAVAVNNRQIDRDYPEVFTINCDTGKYQGYGPMDNADLSSMSRAFCDSGRY